MVAAAVVARSPAQQGVAPSEPDRLELLQSGAYAGSLPIDTTYNVGGGHQGYGAGSSVPLGHPTLFSDETISRVYVQDGEVGYRLTGLRKSLRNLGFKAVNDAYTGTPVGTGIEMTFDHPSSSIGGEPSPDFGTDTGIGVGGHDIRNVFFDDLDVAIRLARHHLMTNCDTSLWTNVTANNCNAFIESRGQWVIDHKFDKCRANFANGGDGSFLRVVQGGDFQLTDCATVGGTVIDITDGNYTWSGGSETASLVGGLTSKFTVNGWKFDSQEIDGRLFKMARLGRVKADFSNVNFGTGRTDDYARVQAIGPTQITLTNIRALNPKFIEAARITSGYGVDVSPRIVCDRCVFVTGSDVPGVGESENEVTINPLIAGVPTGGASAADNRAHVTFRNCSTLGNQTVKDFSGWITPTTVI